MECPGDATELAIDRARRSEVRMAQSSLREPSRRRTLLYLSEEAGFRGAGTTSDRCVTIYQ